MNGRDLTLSLVGALAVGDPMSDRLLGQDPMGPLLYNIHASAAAHLGVIPPPLVRGPVARAQYRAIPHLIVINTDWVNRVVASYPHSYSHVLFGVLAHEIGHSMSRAVLLPRKRSNARRKITESWADEPAGLAMYRAGINPLAFMSLIERLPARSTHPSSDVRIESICRGFTAEMLPWVSQDRYAWSGMCGGGHER